MGVFDLAASGLFESELQDEVDPESVHAHQYRCHEQQGLVLEVDDVPMVIWSGSVGPHLSQDAEGINHCPQVHPREQHRNETAHHHSRMLQTSLQVPSTEGGEDVTGVVDDDDDDSCCDLVGHHGEEDEDDGHAVVQQELMVLSVGFANYEDKLE